MQDVRHDGSVGEEKELNLQELYEKMADPDIDHVRVFNKETGNKVPIQKNWKRTSRRKK